MVIDQRSITHKIILASLLLTVFLPQSHANTKDQQYNDSVVAYNSGNYEEAIVIWRNLADDNYHNAQYSLGVAYFNGEGVAQDLKKAIDWFELAAIGGNVQAMFNMGSAYYQGNGTNQDYTKAVEWWQKAAALEQRSAQYNLGLAYYFGKGVEQDLSRAAESLRQAANNGHLGAKNAITLIEKEIDNANNLEFSEKTDLRQIENKNEKKVKIKVPGTSKLHYSPGIPVRLNAKKNYQNEAYILIKKRKKLDKNYFYISKTSNLKQAAKNLYKTLRIIKKKGYKKIAIEKIPNINIGEAINDRILRASKK